MATNFDLLLSNKVKARYKLWVKYRTGYLQQGQSQVRVYYSYDRADDIDYGRRRLLCLVEQRIQVIEVAILYDNTTQKSINYFYTHDQSTGSEGLHH